MKNESWLLSGDVSIQYQVYRDLLSQDRPDLQARIAMEGWGALLLSKRLPNGHWGRDFYQPKWISTHYTLLDLRHMNLPPNHPRAKASVDLIARHYKSEDGGINPGKTILNSDVCVNGMFLHYACYFGLAEKALQSIIDFLFAEHMPDGGFNCRSNRSGAVHSSLHSTLSVLEGIQTYVSNGYTYRLNELKEVQRLAEEFVLLHQLFLSDRTGLIIHKDFLKLSYPGRWKYNILRALDYFRFANRPWDERMRPAIDVILKKQNRDGTWNVQAHHPGQVHIKMEQAGKASRWNTLRCRRVLKHFAMTS